MIIKSVTIHRFDIDKKIGFLHESKEQEFVLNISFENNKSNLVKLEIKNFDDQELLKCLKRIIKENHE